MTNDKFPSAPRIAFRRPDFDNAIASSPVYPVIEVYGRITVWGDELDLVPEPDRMRRFFQVQDSVFVSAPLPPHSIQAHGFRSKGAIGSE